MTDKEQIIIDGVFINACLVSEKCKEFETCKIKNILRQLARKTAECKEREQDAENWAYKAGLATGKASRYRNALDEIEGMLDNDDFRYCPLDDTEDCHHTTYKNIFDIISKAKGEE